MSHTVDYSKLAETERYNKAIEDCRFYLNDSFEKVIAAIKETISEIDDENKLDMVVRFHLSFIGIQGYPVTVLIEYAKTE